MSTDALKLKKKQQTRKQATEAETSIDQLMKMMDDLDQDVEQVIEAIDPYEANSEAARRNAAARKTTAIVVRDELQFVSEDEDSVGSETPLTTFGGTMSDARKKRRRMKDLQAALEQI